ncbi:GNAT family N-acetyltransferase [Variovorax sp. HJSM1_2]|uniref:GNAT family N-acetyltransferase n=1 Tax=Variovorax sp. HJSM1_2 TaxID=3366263 RepID=UPI003BD79368
MNLQPDDVASGDGGFSASSPPPVFLRRVRLEDAQTMRRFLLELSVPSRRNRFHGGVSAASAKLVDDLVTADGTQHAAWVACIWGANGEEIVGEATWFLVDPARGSAELALSVLDGWQGSGVASRLMSTLIAGAREAGVRHLYGDVLDVNKRMLAFMKKHGLEPGFDAPPDRGVERVSCQLTQSGFSAASSADQPAMLPEDWANY